MNTVMVLMKSHSSIRSYSYKLIDDSLLQDILKCGNVASSSSFSGFFGHSCCHKKQSVDCTGELMAQNMILAAESADSG